MLLIELHHTPSAGTHFTISLSLFFACAHALFNFYFHLLLKKNCNIVWLWKRKVSWGGWGMKNANLSYWRSNTSKHFHHQDFPHEVIPPIIWLCPYFSFYITSLLCVLISLFFILFYSAQSSIVQCKVYWYEAYRESTEAAKKILHFTSYYYYYFFPVPLFILIPHPHRTS